MLGCHFEGSHGGDLAVVLDGAHHKSDSVLLSEVLWWDLDLIIVSLIIGVLALFLLLGLFFLYWHFLTLFLLDEESVRLPSEERLVPVDESHMLVVQLWQLHEIEVV